MFRKVNVKGGLTGGWPHFVKPTTFAKCGGHYSPSRVNKLATLALDRLPFLNGFLLSSTASNHTKAIFKSLFVL